MQIKDLANCTRTSGSAGLEEDFEPIKVVPLQECSLFCYSVMSVSGLAL